MSPQDVVRLLQSALGHTFDGFLPLGIAALAVGLAVTLMQAWLHWNDVSLGFVPKVLAIGLVLLLGWWAFVTGFVQWWQSLARIFQA